MEHHLPQPQLVAAPASIMQPVTNGNAATPVANQGVPPPAPEQPKRKPSTGGWNDPPPINPNRIPKKKKAPARIVPEAVNFMTPAPQPTPAMVPGGPMMRPGGPGMMQPGQPGMMPAQPMMPGGQAAMMPGGPGAMQPNPGMMQNIQQPQFPQENELYQESDLQSEEEPRKEVMASVPTAAAKTLPKEPIPAEHQVRQTTFDDLIKKCQEKATTSQMEKKLNDCIRRLEFLYDKLRANSLSSTILSGLHQMSTSIAARDYGTGIRQYTQIVAHSNFSEISAFMPGLKSLLQIASQLRV